MTTHRVVVVEKDLFSKICWDYEFVYFRSQNFFSFVQNFLMNLKFFCLQVEDLCLELSQMWTAFLDFYEVSIFQTNLFLQKLTEKYPVQCPTTFNKI